MTETADRHWTEAIGLDEGIEDETHDVEPETFARVFYHGDGSVTVDEGWRGAFIETDEHTLCQLEDWR